MAETKKLSMTLTILSITLLVVIVSFVVVLVNSTQNLKTDFDIIYEAPVYDGPPKVSLNIDNSQYTIANATDLGIVTSGSKFEINFDDENYIVAEEPIVQAHNMLFCGWYLDSNFTNKASFPLTASTLVQLYPKLMEGNVTLQYSETDGGYKVMAGTGYPNTSATVVVPDYYTYEGELVPVVTTSGRLCDSQDASGIDITDIYLGRNLQTAPGFMQYNYSTSTDTCLDALENLYYYPTTCSDTYIDGIGSDTTIFLTIWIANNVEELGQCSLCGLAMMGTYPRIDVVVFEEGSKLTIVRSGSFYNTGFTADILPEGVVVEDGAFGDDVI